jgi:hypothetical protein
VSASTKWKPGWLNASPRAPKQRFSSQNASFSANLRCMKFVKWLIIIVASIFGLFVTVTFFLPKDYAVERSLDMAAPAVVIYSQVANLETWQEWNPWNEMDEDMVITMGDTIVGPGASYSWTSEVTGNGTMRIVASDPPSSVTYELVFEGYEEYPSESRFLIDEQEGQSSVSWSFEGSVGEQFFGRWMTLIIDKAVGASFEKGLANLKEKVEAMPAELPVAVPVP